jgi:hypothetical protein
MGMVAAIGAGISAGGAIAGGVQANRAGYVQQQQANIVAGQQMASATYAANNHERQTQYAISRARAVAAAGGGGAGDTTVQDVIARIAQEGAYRSQIDLYEGETQAQATRYKGEMARYSGKQEERASFIRAAGTLASYGAKSSEGQSLFDRYGAGGPMSGSGFTDYGVGDLSHHSGLDNPYNIYGSGY